jgi:hypothetical protein
MSMDIFGSLFRRREPVDANAEIARKQIEAMAPKIIGIDLGSVDMSCEAIFQMQPDGKMKVIELNHFYKTIDLKAE